MVYKNPITGERRILGGSNVNQKARELEAAGWIRTDGPPLIISKPKVRRVKRRRVRKQKPDSQPPTQQAVTPESKPGIEPGADA